MKSRLTPLEVYRIAHKRVFTFAAVFAALFTLSGLARYLYVTHRIQATTEAEAEAAASRIRQEIAFTNSWNLNAWRHTEFAAGNFCVFTTEGFQIEMGEFIPGLIGHVTLPDEAIYDKPKTIKSPVEEYWRLFGKRLSGGIVMLGILDLDDNLKDLEGADNALLKESKKFGSTLEDAIKIRARDTSTKIDYAIIDDSGELRAATGWFPLKIVDGPIHSGVAVDSFATIGGKSHFLHRTTILDSFGKIRGQIVVSKDVTIERRAVRSLVLFNVGLGGFCWLAVLVFVGGNIITGEVEKRTLEMSLEEALRQGEGQTIEFKEGISKKNLAAVISAFANTNAGVIFVGVKDNREIIGVAASNPQDEEQLKQTIRDIVQNWIDPLIIPELRFFQAGDRKVLRVSVPLGDRPPYLGDGVVYRRVLTAVIPAKADDIRKMR